VLPKNFEIRMVFGDNLDDLEAMILAVETDEMPELENIFAFDINHNLLGQATEGVPADEQTALTFVQTHRAPPDKQHPSAPAQNPLMTKTTRDGSRVQKGPPVVAGATQFYIALLLEFHYKLLPGTFAGTNELRNEGNFQLPDAYGDKGVALKELRGSTAGAACTHIAEGAKSTIYEPRAQYVSQEHSI
jgi:hypothetical protein